jgi:hypothetical protein
MFWRPTLRRNLFGLRLVAWEAVCQRLANIQLTDRRLLRPPPPGSLARVAPEAPQKTLEAPRSEASPAAAVAGDGGGGGARPPKADG